MTKTPAVSVIMPAYNAEKYIARAIESILNQTLSDFELIIIEDASSDHTSKIVNKYSKIDKRIRVINHKRNLQIAQSLNEGVELSRSNIVARMDADDISLPERLELQYKYLKSHPKVAVLGANILIIDDRGNIISKREYPESDKDLKSVMFRYSPFAHPVVMFRKNVFKEFGGYDVFKVPCEDIDLWFKIGSKYTFATVPEFVMKYTIIKNSNSNKKLKNLELLGLKVKIEAIKKYGYRPNFLDILYNSGQYLSMWFMPANLRVWTYNFLRSHKII